MDDAGDKNHLKIDLTFICLFHVTYREPCLLNKVSNSVKTQLNYSVTICDTACPVMWKAENIRCNILIMRVTKVWIVEVGYD